MLSSTVFLDTSALLAILHLRDSLHDRAMAVHRRLTQERTEIVTTEWVPTELLGGAARPPLRAAAITAVERLRASPRATRSSPRRTSDGRPRLIGLPHTP